MFVKKSINIFIWDIFQTNSDWTDWRIIELMLKYLIDLTEEH